MLKINKILSKKIKSSLSWRGLFPFCHSRESGNPSSPSFRAKQVCPCAGRGSNLNLNGFTLIELMVAVVILAIALVGIFLAFSSGWMGMANARDRTVATNYARERMEDIKNMDFELITNTNLGVAEIIEGKFNRVVTVIDEYNNLKKITTRVFWNDKAGKPKNVETNMLISRTQLNPREADNIILYADPYYTVLPSNGNANIMAVIKDIKGNTKIDWDGGDIHFAILGYGYSDFPKSEVEGSLGSYLGYLGPGVDEIYVTPNEGRAEIAFTATPIGGVLKEGDVIIEASVVLPDGSTISNTVKITVTLDVVMVELTAIPLSIKADGIETSTIIARLLNSGLQLVTGASNNITFNISGEGTFIDSEGAALPNTVTITPPVEPGGTVTIYVKSISDTPGVATVTATSEGLLSDTVNIITTGQPKYISILAHPDIIYTDDIVGATVIVTITDINGNPVNYTGTIGLSTNGTGTFGQDTDCVPEIPPDSLCFYDVSSKYTTFSSDSTGIVTITASGEGLISGNTDIEVRSALIANNIALTAEPPNIPVGGGISEASTIKAIIREDWTIVSTYSNDITFEIISDTSGSARFSDTSTYINLIGDDYGNDGEATVQLLSSSNVGTATIEVSTINSYNITIKETVQVAFYSDAHHILLSADPPKMEVLGGTPDACMVTATIVDEDGTKVQNYNEVITFTFLEGHLSSAKFLSADTISLTKTVKDGVADVALVSQYDAGTVKIKADSLGIYGYLNIPVGINLELAVPSNITYDNETYEVSFDILVQGAELLLEEMQVSWLPDISENLIKIEVKPPDPADSITIFDNIIVPASSGELINVDDITLWEEISNVKLYFNASMSGKTLEIIFNPNSGNYPVEIIVPTI